MDKNRQTQEALKKMWLSKEISDRLYHKSLVQLGYDFFNSGDTEGAIECLGSVNPTYFENEQRVDMEEDQSYANIVVVMAYKMIQLSIVDMGSDPEPTMPKATA